MATLLDLPRELFLIVCSLLSPVDLAALSQCSRKHYLASQEWMYSSITLVHYEALVKLVWTMMKIPVVSQITAQQRARWRSLSDATLRDRDVKHLNVTIDGSLSGKATILHSSRCLGAMARKCPDVHITLMIHGYRNGLVEELVQTTFPNVRHLILCLGPYGQSLNAQHFWPALFYGAVFPDLRHIKLDTINSAPAISDSLLERMAIANEIGPDGERHHREGLEVPMDGIRYMESISICNDHILGYRTLGKLFSSSVVPERLKKLEIMNCANLYFLNGLGFLSTLLQRTLPVLQELKLHLITDSDNLPSTQLNTTYAARIAENPETHLCNAIRTLGQDIKSLDLALPVACNRMFLPGDHANRRLLSGTPLCREPLETLPQRLIDHGYKYRRLITYSGICLHYHEWDDMVACAEQQDGSFSWEVLSGTGNQGIWCVGGYQTVHVEASDVLNQSF